MSRYSGEAWKALGSAISQARLTAGKDDTKNWADEVGRSTRILLGLERGEPVGPATLRRVEAALGWEAGHAHALLEMAEPASIPPTAAPPPERQDRPSVWTRMQSLDEARQVAAVLLGERTALQLQLDFQRAEADRIAALQRTYELEINKLQQHLNRAELDYQFAVALQEVLEEAGRTGATTIEDQRAAFNRVGDTLGLAAKRGTSAGRKARADQDAAAEAPDE